MLMAPSSRFTFFLRSFAIIPHIRRTLVITRISGVYYPVCVGPKRKQSK